MFGEWSNNLTQLNADFISSGPVKYVVIPNFFTEEWANKLNDEFPLPDTGGAPWKKFDDPIEKRYTLWEFNDIQSVVETFRAAQTQHFINCIEQITGFSNIIIDPNYEHGSGLIAMPRGGKLGIHLDYNINKQSGKQRRCNLLVYLNKVWKTEYGGSLQVGDSVDACRDIAAPAWNTAIIIENSNCSYHGVPRPLECPEGQYRKAIAMYYSSEPTENAVMSYRAVWFPTVDDMDIKKLYEMRNIRALTPEDWREKC